LDLLKFIGRDYSSRLLIDENCNKLFEISSTNSFFSLYDIKIDSDVKIFLDVELISKYKKFIFIQKLDSKTKFSNFNKNGNDNDLIASQNIIINSKTENFGKAFKNNLKLHTSRYSYLKIENATLNNSKNLNLTNYIILDKKFSESLIEFLQNNSNYNYSTNNLTEKIFVEEILISTLKFYSTNLAQELKCYFSLEKQFLPVLKDFEINLKYFIKKFYY
jgi:hypothetical protein